MLEAIDDRIQQTLNLPANHSLSDDCMVCGAKVNFQIQTNAAEGVLWESSKCPACDFKTKPKAFRIH